MACVAITRKKKFSQQIALYGSTYEGTPCVRNHLNERGKTVRWSGGGMCVECSKVFKRNYNQSDIGRENFRRCSWRYDGIPEPTRPRPEGCEICGKKNRTGKGLANDHCHTTNQFRGWLCTSCNASLGHLGDNMEGIMRVVSYLQKNTPAV